MVAPTPSTDEPFPRPLFSFEDDAGRRITAESSDDSFEDLVSMYGDFAAKGLSQGLPPRTEERTREWLSGLLDDGVNVHARHEEGAVGHAALVPFDDMAELVIFVHQDYQEAGIGSRLIRVLLGEGEDAGIDRVWLTVERTNTVAVNLYHSVGFETTAEGIDLEMELDLDDPAEPERSS